MHGNQGSRQVFTSNSALLGVYTQANDLLVTKF